MPTSSVSSLIMIRRLSNIISISETNDALKDYICEAIAEIQQHTIDNVLKNWIDRVGYCMASRSRHLNEIIFHY